MPANQGGPAVVRVQLEDSAAMELDYSVPRQDLRIPMNRFPTGPRSRLILGRARPARPAHAAVAATA